MRKAVGVLLIILLLGSMLATAGSTAYATSIEAQDNQYEKFWEILNKEAELVVQFNHTGDSTLAQELIQNSRLGAENAANISALIWQALEELKASGVKTYYTAEELKEMAQNISQNGLPQETVEALKAQGWTDEQIQALEEYIVKNADEINEDFNMTSFLENFSMAFIDVAFKYNEYEAWALKKWKWINPQEVNMSLGDSLINPVLADEWLDFYKGYSEGNYSKMKLAAGKLRDKMYDMIVGKTLSRETLTELREQGGHWQLMRLRKDVYVMWWLKNGGVVFRTYNSADNSSYGVYYWPNATTAYELVGNIEALVMARELGNDNPEVQMMLNQKVAELKEALTVMKCGGTMPLSEGIQLPENLTPPVDPSKKPITPIDPINPEPLKNSINGVDGGTPTLAESSPNPITVIPADEVTKIALDPDSSEGTLKIDGIEVKPLNSGPNYVNYVVIVHMHTENDAVKNVKINLHDYSTGSSDSGTISQIGPYANYTWESKLFSTSIKSENGKLTATGEVEITYTPKCDKLLQGSGKDESLLSSCGDRTITRQYSATFSSSSSVNWDLVGIRIETSSDDITKGGSVTYKVVVENKNNVALDGVDYFVSIPYSDSDSWNYSRTIDVPANAEITIVEKTVTYEEAGTYVASASIKWNGKSKSAETSITVTSGTTETISMNVGFSPNNPTEGDSVEFNVSLKNLASMSRTVTVKLFIDGVEKSSKSLTIGGGSTESVTLTWIAKAGEREYRVEVWESGKLEATRSGSIEVDSNQENGSNTVNANLEITSFDCMPKEVGLYEWRFDRDKVSCTVVIQNKGPRIQIAPRVVIDDIETFWLNTRILSGNSSLTIKYEVKFSDELAQIMYGPSATALSFVRTVEERGGTVCQRRVCYNSTRIYHLPRNHTMGLRIYGAEGSIPTATVLAETSKLVITVRDDNYFIKKGIIVYKEIGKRTVPIILGTITIEAEATKEGAMVVGKYLGKKIAETILEWLGW